MLEPPLPTDPTAVLDGDPGFGVNVVGHISSSLGFGVAARSLITALLGAGVPVATVDLPFANRGDADSTYAYLNIPASAPSLPYPVTIVSVILENPLPIWTARPQWFAQTYNLLMPFWELPVLPDLWRGVASQFDAILAPTEHIAAAFRNAISTPVRTFPLAADISPVIATTRAALGLPEDKVLFAASWDQNSGRGRKNGVGVLRAFEAALELGTDAALVVKLNGDESDPLFHRMLARLPADSVFLAHGYVPYGEVLGLYSVCDAFISLHRAEGLGLGLQEAMLLGKPVLATGWSGNMDFMDEGCAAVVPYTLTPVVDTQHFYNPPVLSAPQLWAEPDVVEAARLMKRLAENERWRQRTGIAGRIRMERYAEHWRQAAPQLIAGLYEAHGRQREPLSARVPSFAH